jgi:hypothetical protein
MLYKVRKNHLNYSLLVWKKAFNFNKNWAFENNIIRTANGVEYPTIGTPNVGEQSRDDQYGDYWVTAQRSLSQ